MEIVVLPVPAAPMITHDWPDRIRLIASCCLELYVIELPWRSVPADETEFVGITGIIDSVVLLAIVLRVGLGLF